MSPTELEPFINKLREKLLLAITRDQSQLFFSTLFMHDLADALESARDALVAEAPQWQKLRDLLGLNGWYDGKYQGVANPDEIVTHIKHVSQERARLLFESMAAKRAEAARDALAGQSDPPEGYKFGAEQRVLLASDETIRNSLPGDQILGNITDLEKLVFWTTHTNPEQGKAFRALLEGRVYVQEVTP